MRIVLRGILLLAAAAAASVTAAKADTIWTLDDVTFDDGGLVLNGTFAVNTYGYLTQSSIVLTTTGGSHSNGTGGPLPGDTYNATLVAGLINNVGGTGLPDDTVTFFSSTGGYGASITLEFADILSAPTSNNPIVIGASSFECVGFTCPNLTETRYVTGGYAVGGVPEPATWAMMAAGFAGLGIAGWRKRRAEPTVAA